MNDQFRIMNPTPEQQAREQADLMLARFNAIGQAMRGGMPYYMVGDPFWTTYYQAVLDLRTARDMLMMHMGTVRAITQRVQDQPADVTTPVYLLGLMENLHELAANAMQDAERTDRHRYQLLRLETKPRQRYAWSGVIALLDIPAIDTRVLPTPVDMFAMCSRLPVPIRLSDEFTEPYELGLVVGVIIGVTVTPTDDGALLHGSGWVELTNDEYERLIGQMPNGSGKISLRCEVDGYAADNPAAWKLSGAVLATSSASAAWGDRTYIDLEDTKPDDATEAGA